MGAYDLKNSRKFQSAPILTVNAEDTLKATTKSAQGWIFFLLSSIILKQGQCSYNKLLIYLDTKRAASSPKKNAKENRKNCIESTVLKMKDSKCVYETKGKAIATGKLTISGLT